MGAGRGASSGGAAVAVQLFEFVRIKKADLLFGDRMDNGPVIPEGSPDADKNGSWVTILKELHHARPELVQ